MPKELIFKNYVLLLAVKKLFQHIISVSMAILVMFSTMSFTVDKHFCGSYLVDLAVFSKAQSCGMDMSSMEEDGHCCSNEKVEVDGQDELDQSVKVLDLDQQIFLISFSHSYLNLFEGLPEQIIPFKNYTPPLLVYDIQLQDQVFLI